MLAVIAPTTNVTTMTWFVPANKSHTISYGGACSQTDFYFSESNCEYDNDADGNGSRCLPYNSIVSGTACQSASLAAMTITNNGNVVTNIDGNFTSAFTGNDVNLVLKVWMGTGSGCGTGGFGGWEGGWKGCSITNPTTPVNQTQCREYNSENATASGRLINALGIGDTNQLCFSGDFNGNVTAGSHVKDFNTTSV